VISLDDINETWLLLTEHGPGANSLEVRELRSEGDDSGPLFAVDSEGLRHVLFPLPGTGPVDEDRRSSGVHVAEHRLLDRGELRQFVDLQCRKPHLAHVFSFLVMDVLALISEHGKRPDHACVTVVGRWREFLERSRVERPGLSRLAGIFGELWYLREVVRRDPDAVRYWRGPDAAPQDIVAPGGALEVKTRLDGGNRWQINGLSQLDRGSNRALHFATLLLSEDHDGVALDDLVNDITELGGSRFHLLALLQIVGVDGELLASREPRFRVRDARVFCVDERFPKLLESDLADRSLPSGVSSLSYTIDLDQVSVPPLEHDELIRVFDQMTFPGEIA
jgi:hypothetical protein